MKSRTLLKYPLIGAFLGYFVFHPLIMVLGHQMLEANAVTEHSLLKIIVTSFSLGMFPLAFPILLFCALIAFLYGRTRLMETSLRAAKTDLERRVEERTSALRTANEALKKEIADRKRAEKEVQRNFDVEAVMNSVLRLSIEGISLEEILTQTLDLILSIPWLALQSRGCIFLVESDPEILILKVERGLDERLTRKCARVSFGRCICGRAASKREIEFVSCIDQRHDISYEDMQPHGHYCVPILFGTETLGVINSYVKEGHERSEREEQFLQAVANTLAGIIKRRHSEQELQDTLTKLRKAMAMAIDLVATTVEVRDPYTAGHQKRVSDIARSIATEMGLANERIDGIRMAGLVHDIGKLGVPAELLVKPTRLTDLEFSLIKTHPTVAYEILKNVEFPWPVAQIAYQHHERLNGSGYPHGLSGEDILLEARILAVADVVEAMASHRPYRPALGIEKALDEILKNRGILYDAEVVDACLRLFREKGDQIK